MYCGKCGTQNQENLIFCSNCGCSLSVSVPEQKVEVKEATESVEKKPKKMNKKKKKAIIISVIAVILAIAITLGLLFGFGVIGNSDKDSEKPNTKVEKLTDNKDSLGEYEPYYIKTTTYYHEDGSEPSVYETTYSKNDVELKEIETSFYGGEKSVRETVYDYDKNEIHYNYKTYNTDGQLMTNYEYKEKVLATGVTLDYFMYYVASVRYYEKQSYTEYYDGDKDEYLCEITFDDKGRIADATKNGVSTVLEKAEISNKYKIKFSCPDYDYIEYIYEDNSLKAINGKELYLDPDGVFYATYVSCELHPNYMVKKSTITDEEGSYVEISTFDEQGRELTYEYTSEIITEDMFISDTVLYDKVVEKVSDITKMEYDDNDNIVSEILTTTETTACYYQGKTDEEIDTITEKTSYEYDEKGNLITITATKYGDFKAYSNGELMEEFSGEYEEETNILYSCEYEYDGDKIISVRKEEGRGYVPGVLSPQEVYVYYEVYDEHENIIREEEFYGEYIYDSNGNKVLNEYGDKITTDYKNEYNSKGRLISVIAQNSERILSETTYKYLV